MKNRITKCIALIAILCVLATVFAVPLASAASYSKVYGKTQEKVRVRESASTNAAVIDNIIKGACVYVTSSKESGSSTFVKVNYRAEDGEIESGWLCQNDGDDTYVKILSASQAQDAFNVSGGNLPSKRVGTFTDAQRSKSASSSGSSYIQHGSTGSKVKDVQTKLKALGFYTGELTGNAGDKTVAAIKKFQDRYNLTADGVAGPSTIAKIDAVYAQKGGSVSSSGSGLKLNDSGSSVRDLQTDLTTLGYYWAEITGNFGSKTEAAVKSFQQKNGLTADGVAGSKTIAAISSALGESGATSSSTGMKLGSTGTKVRALQQDLTTLGFYYGDVTGHYGNMTKNAVAKFQKSRGLTQDGVAGTSTVNAIASALGGSGALSSSSSSSTSLREGDSGDSVEDLQTRLKKLGYYYGDITGRFGSLTKSAVRKFQDANDMTVDGIAGTKTLNKLYSLTGGGTISTGGAAGTAVLEADSYGRITKDNVNLRSSYSTTSSAKTKLEKGDLFRITRKHVIADVTWYYITIKESGTTFKGYIRSDMMELITEGEYATGGGDSIDLGDAEILGMIRVIGDKVNLREEPDSDSDSLGYAYIGDVFYYVDTDDGWYQTQSGAWIDRDYCKVMTGTEIEEYLGSSYSGGSYREGDSGPMVEWIQTALEELGYYDDEISGTFGRRTKQAVMDFQGDHDISRDGVVGPKTMAKLQEEYNEDVAGTGTATTWYGTTIYNLDWFKHQNCIQKAGVRKGYDLKLTDVITGRSFKITVQSSSGNHADVEPKTKEDTAVLASLYGVSTGAQLKAQNKYARRAVVVTTTGTPTYQFVGSIYAIPHGADTVSGNNFDGQFCLHFLGSKTHGGTSGNVQIDPDHKAQIEYAVKYLEGKDLGDGKKIHIETTCPESH